MLGSVFVASLLGSLHCAGMCGGIAAIASNPGEAPPRRRLKVKANVGPLALYHGGRLLSYLTLGAIAGSLGSQLNRLGRLADIEQIAAGLSGLTMVAWAVAMLSGRGRRLGIPSRTTARWFSPIVGRALGIAPTLRGLLLGVATGLLPCGWLYAFVIAGAGSGSAGAGALLLAAFWAGSVPILSGVSVLAGSFTERVRRHAPTLGAVLMLALGLGSLWLHANSSAHARTLFANASRLPSQPAEASHAGPPLPDKPTCH
jgi:uncharacterized protein